MTFLNPFVLLGLIAASIPVIIHLLNLRKLKKIEFSTLAFLKELQKNKIRKIKIKQILLLIIRTLIIILLVFIFSRPVIKGYLSEFGSHTKTSVIIILDDSYSMNVIDEKGQLFKQAKNAVDKVLNLMEEGDDLSVLRLSDLPKESIKTSSNFLGFRKELENYQSTCRFNVFSLAVKAASGILSESKNFNKEIYLISDFQKSHFLLSEEERKTVLNIFDNNTKFFSIRLGKKETDNIAVTEVQLKNKIFQKDKPVTIDAVIKNFGKDPVNNEIVSVYLDGKRVSQKSINVSSSATATLTFTPKSYGYLKGFVEIEDDAIPQDNKRYFTIFVPEKIKILFVQKNKSDGLYLNLALNIANRSLDSTKVSDIFEIEETGAIAPINLNKYEVVMLNNPPEFNKDELQKIKTYCESGGGIILFPSTQSAFLDPVLKELGLGYVLAPAGKGGLKDSTGNKTVSYLSFSKVDYDHPIMSDIFEASGRNKKNIESPEIYQSVSYRFNNQVQNIIELSNNAPFLAESRINNKKILIYSILPDLSWSDFPVKGIFLPMIYRSVFYLANKDDDHKSITIGENYTVQLKAGYSNKEYSLFDPDGMEEKIAFSASASGLIYNFNSSSKPGIYDITEGKNIIKSIPVNLNPDEADLKKLSEDELRIFLNAFGLADRFKEISPDDDIKQILEQSRYGIEIWKTLVIILILLVIAEMLIARDSKKQIADLNV